MDLVKVLISVIATCVAIHVGDASGCCFPPTYQGFQEIVKATVKGDHLSVLTGTIQYWHDNISRRSAFVENLVVDGVPTSLRIIKDYNVTNTKYLIIGTRCTLSSLHGDYPYGCVPDGATNEQRRYLGKAGSNNMMKIGTFDNDHAQDVSRLTVDAENCYLLNQITVVPSGSQPYMQHVLFSNLTEGISDYTVFDIPSSCQQSIVG